MRFQSLMLLVVSPAPDMFRSMLLREDRRGVLAIGQQSHAWISGQLARAWGNARFPAPEPREEVCLAAEQHDVGMALWDLEPTLNPQTGLPYAFIEMPLAEHLRLWSAAPRRLLTQSRYAALLVSRHGARLYERRDLAELREGEAAAVRDYLAAQLRFQEGLVESLAADPISAGSVQDSRLTGNSQLIWAWDFLSLAICLDWAPRPVPGVPSAEGRVKLALAPAEEHRVWLDPWPFEEGRLTVRCEARRLTAAFRTEEELSAGLAAAPWETLEFELLSR
jgi:Protein of unknown function (DUF3891)